MNQINYNSKYVIHFNHNGILKFLEAPKKATYIDFEINENNEHYTCYYVFKYGDLKVMRRFKTDSVEDDSFLARLLKHDYFVYFSSDLEPVEVIELGGEE